MANRRMFCKDITSSDAFLDMPLTSQALYFQLWMHADDEGFLWWVKRLIRMLWCAEDDFKILIAKRFVLVFSSGICVIKHRKMNNYLQKDRLKETVYLEEKKNIFEKDNKSYSEITKQLTIEDKTARIQDVYKLDSQYSIVEGSIEEISKDFFLSQEEFELLWTEWSSKSKIVWRSPWSKKKARDKALRLNIPYDTMLEKIKSYFAHKQSVNEFTQHMTTRLNQEGYNEDYEVVETIKPLEIIIKFHKEKAEKWLNRELGAKLAEKYREKYGLELRTKWLKEYDKKERQELWYL